MNARKLLLIVSFVILSIPLFTVYAGSEGSITSLNASGGANLSETITISISLRADSKLNNSNVYFEIVSPSGVVVATHNYSVPNLKEGDTASHSWKSNNSGYPDMGTYTLKACWSKGGAGNCNVASASTSFYSADSLGPMALIGLIMIGVLALKIHPLKGS